MARMAALDDADALAEFVEEPVAEPLEAEPLAEVAVDAAEESWTEAGVADNTSK